MKHKIENNKIIQSEGLQQDLSNFSYELGWRDEVIPDFDSDIETLGSRYYDSEADNVTFTIVNKQLPTIEEAKQRKISELDVVVDGLYKAITWYVVKKWASGESTSQAVKDKIIEIDTDRTQIEVNINAFTDVIDVIKFQLPYSQINTLKLQLENIG